jgi:carbonic anhydrase
VGTGARTEGPFPVKELVRQWLKAGYVEEVNGNNSTLAIERVGNLCYDVTGAGRWPLSSQRGRTEMAVADEFLQANDQYAATFTKGGLPMPPARHVAVVTCMDARLDPAKFLGLQEGDAHVIRNAGGRAADAIRSLAISQQLLGTREVIVIHHTDCGMLTFTNEQLQQKLRDDLGAEATLDFLPFADLEQSVRDDLQAIRRTPLLLQDVPVRGFIYDVRTGRLQEVQ